MSEYRTVLERVQRRAHMPEPAMERLLRRRDRRLRNQRIAAAVVGLVVAVAGIGFGVLALRGRQVGRPASGGLPSPGPPDDGIVGIVLPTVAIWTALAVLGLTTLAIVRLRRFVEASPRHRTTGAPPVPGHGPAAEPRITQKEGVSTMDSREKMGVKIPQVEVPKVRVDEGRVSRLNRWLVGAVVLLVAGVAALGTALIAQSGEEPAPPPRSEGLASAEVVQALDAQTAALNAADEAALAATYADDAVLADTVAGQEFEGADAIAARYTGPLYEGFELVLTSEVIQVGDFAAVAFTYNPSTMMDSGGSGIAVFEFDEELKIVHQWLMGF